MLNNANSTAFLRHADYLINYWFAHGSGGGDEIWWDEIGGDSRFFDFLGSKSKFLLA